MERICNCCDTKMVNDCDIKVCATYDIQGKKDGKFAGIKCAICPKCGYVMLYCENFKDFDNE